MKEIIRKIKNRIYLMIGRAILTAVTSTGKTQKLRVKGLNGETISDVDHIQNYGFESYPVVDSDAEAVIVFPNGNRDNGIAVVVGNRGKRPRDLLPGETCLYSDSFVTLKTGDALIWMPNVLVTDPLTGVPHGGPTAGIVKLRGK